MESNNAPEQPAQPSFSWARSLMAIIVCLLIAAVVYNVGYRTDTPTDNRRALITFGLAKPLTNRLASRFTDADENLVADAPADAAKLIDPDKLTFSFIATQTPEQYEQSWQDFTAHLAKVTGKKVEYLRFDSRDGQLRALKDGKLHVTGLNTGSVPCAVNACGFVPVCTAGNDAGKLAYKMSIIVPAASKISGVADLKGRSITFTDTSSNSGYKAALVILYSDFGLEPERDYFWRFSRGHKASLQGVASGSYEAAAVASDLIDQYVSQELIKSEQVRTIYESEDFPRWALGHVHNLKPELAAKVREAFDSFRFAGTSLEAEFAASGAIRFVPVSYKQDFALIRRIDDAAGIPHIVE